MSEDATITGVTLANGYVIALMVLRENVKN